MNAITLEELDHYVGLCDDELETASEQGDTESAESYTAERTDLLAARDGETLAGHPLAARRIEDSADSAESWGDTADARRLLIDLIRGGHVEEYDEATCYSRRPRTMRLDGKRWVIG